MNQRMSDYPVRFEVDYPELPSRGLALLGALLFIKGLLLIPHVIILYALGIAASLVVYIGFWAVLITGKYPMGLFEFVVGVLRWQTRADSWMYGFADRYPPFSLGLEYYPVRFEIDFPESSSRALALLGALLVYQDATAATPLGHPNLPEHIDDCGRLHRTLGCAHNRQVPRWASHLRVRYTEMELQGRGMAGRLDGPLPALQPELAAIAPSHPSLLCPNGSTNSLGAGISSSPGCPSPHQVMSPTPIGERGKPLRA